MQFVKTRLRIDITMSSDLLRKNVDLYKKYGDDINTVRPREVFKPELLAPAGGWPQLRAAAANGAGVFK